MRLQLDSSPKKKNIRTRPAFWFLLALLSIFIKCYTSYAGTIVLESDSTTRVSDRQVHTRFHMKNNGTDTVRNIELKAMFLDQETDEYVSGMIVPNESTFSDFHFTLPPHATGTFPVFFQLTYTEPSGLPHSAAMLGVVKTDGYRKPDLKISVLREVQADKYLVTTLLSDPGGRIPRVFLNFHGSDEFWTSPTRQHVQLNQGIGSAAFQILNKKDIDARKDPVQAFVSAEYDLEGVHYLVYSPIALTPEPSATLGNKEKQVSYFPPAVGIFFILTLSLIIVWIYRIHWKQESTVRLARNAVNRFEILVDIFVLIAIEAFILYHLAPGQLITDTITTGGDTASHYYTLDYLRQQLLPQGKITGWTPGNYAGFPILQFYFPLPFLIMCGLGLFMPITVAFKWGTLLGTFLLPVGAYGMLRRLRNPFPGPAIAALFTLPFLFNPAFSAWGGNLLSTLSGEFSYSLSLALSLFLLGNIYRGCMDQNRVIQNGILIFLVGFSHGYTLLYVEAVSLFFLITPYGFMSRFTYLLKIYLLGFLLLAFWLLPLILFTPYTTAYHSVWHIHSIKEVISPAILPFVATGALSAIGYVVVLILTLARRTGKPYPFSVPWFFLFGIATACLMYILAPKLGVVDIRYLPIAQLAACLLGAYGLGNLTNRFLHRRWAVVSVLLIIAAATGGWTAKFSERAAGFAQWNYEGFESKTGWGLFNRINRFLSGSFQDPRVVFEHSSLHNLFGTTRAFESLPLFSGRATLEGLYMQASISAPFVFYIQSEISKEKSTPFKQYSYSDMDFKGARRHLQMFNVRELILRSPEAKQAIRADTGYRHVKTFGLYEIWSLAADDCAYVMPLKNEPVLFRTSDWKSDVFKWFMDDTVNDIYLVDAAGSAGAESGGHRPGNSNRFQYRADTLDLLKPIPIDTQNAVVSEKIRPQEILISTNWIGKPLLVKMSYHPNWHVEGADKIYRVSPSFMLIYPEKEHVRLYYDRGWTDWAGFLLTAAGVIILVFQLPPLVRMRKRRKLRIPVRSETPKRKSAFFPWNPSARARRRLLGLGLLIGILIIGAVTFDTLKNNPDRLFNRSVKLKDLKRFDQARTGFERIAVTAGPVSNLRSEAAYYIAICFYLEKNYPMSIEAFNNLLDRFPNGPRSQEGQYHIGLCHFMLGEEHRGIEAMRLVVDRYPGTLWAAYAKKRLREHHVDIEPDVVKRTISPAEKMDDGIYFFNLEKYNEARIIFEEIINRYPYFKDVPQALACLALIYYKQQDCSKTIQYYERLIRGYPYDPLVPEAWYHIGRCREMSGNMNGAAGAYQILIDRYASSIYGKYALEKLKIVN